LVACVAKLHCGLFRYWGTGRNGFAVFSIKDGLCAGQEGSEVGIKGLLSLFHKGYSGLDNDAI
jgi:hypothetical protein